MLKNPFTAKQPKSHIDTSLVSILFEDVIESIIATGPEIAKRKAIKLSTKLFIIELFIPILFQTSNNLILLLLILVFLYSFYAVSEYITENENKDPKEVVIDEVIGQSIPIYLFEVAHGSEKNSQEAILFYLYIFINE